MKRLLALCAVALLSTQTAQAETLIVYLSRTHNTQAAAELVQKEIGGDLLALETAKPYPQDYQKMVAQVRREQETNARPALKTRINTDKYDRIVIGFPTWAMQLPPPVKTFLATHNLQGKTVLPLNTNAGYGAGSSFDELKALCAGCKVKQGLSLEGGKERDGVLFVMQGAKRQAAAQKIKQWLVQTGENHR